MNNDSRFEDSPDQTEIVENVRVRILLQVQIIHKEEYIKFPRELKLILKA